MDFKKSDAKVEVVRADLTSPTHFGQVHEACVAAMQEFFKKSGGNCRLVFHLSPGTPAMAAVWILLAKTRFPAELIQSSKEHGVQRVSIPFDISADYIPDLLRKPDDELVRLSQGLPPEAPEFSDIIHRCTPMKRLIARARRVAPRAVPVLILGESGTGKELLARAIHRSSASRNGPFIVVNCGAIPHELIESELFGHEKGAFTGPTASRAGSSSRSCGSWKRKLCRTWMNSRGCWDEGCCSKRRSPNQSVFPLTFSTLSGMTNFNIWPNRI